MRAEAERQPETPAAIKVDGVEIPEAEIAREMQHHPAGSLAEARHLAIQALIIRRLLSAEAAKRGLGTEEVPEDDIGDDPRIARLLEEEIRTPEPDAESCRRYFDNNRRMFDEPERFDASHILLASPADERAQRQADLARAQDLIAKLQNEPARFAELAQAHSACPSRDQGGQLGLVSRGQTVPEFETYLFSLNPGELCPVPIETRYGIHIIKLDRKLPGDVARFEDWQDEIEAHLRQQSYRMALRQYLLLLAGAAEIEGFDMEAATSPLVQ